MSEVSLKSRTENISTFFRTITWFNLLFATQLIIGIAYAVVVDAPIPNFRYYLIPFVWITIGILAVWYTTPSNRNTQHTIIGAIVAVSYFFLILYLSGMIGPTRAAIEATAGSSSIGVEWHRPLGWGPILTYSGNRFAVTLIPYQVIGYLALSYLIYAAILDISKSATAGVIGLAPCPGCAAPLLAPLLAGAAGTSSAFVFLISYTYEIATILFVGAVGLLYWQPTGEKLLEAVSENLSRIAGGLALLVAVIHLFHPQLGFPRLVQHIQLGTLYDPRPLLFTISALAILCGVLLVYNSVAERSIYLLGIGLMLAYILGYVSWHTVLEHGAFWPYIEAHGHHDHGILETIGMHLFDDSRELVSKVAELILLSILIVLYWRSKP
jgi:hypothetical protein